MTKTIEPFYTEKPIKVNPLYRMYRDIKDRMITADNVSNQNITPELLDYIGFQIDHKKLINMAVIGEVAHGKSAVACGICALIIDRLNKYLKLKNPKEMDIYNVCSDQLEFSRKAHDINNVNTCFVIDEDNKMSYVGANATTEKARLTSFSEVQAQRYIHRIYCSPSSVADDQSRVILQVINYDEEECFTRFLVWYRNSEPYGDDMRIIGYADLQLVHILKSSWYETYRKKKFKKMDLINDAGIDDIRDFEQAKIILEIYEENKALAKYQMLKISDLNLAVKQAVRKQKSRSSLILKEEFIRDIKSILDNVFYQNRESQKMDKIKFEMYEKMRDEKFENKNYMYETFAQAYLNFKLEIQELTIDNYLDSVWIEKLFNLNEQESRKVWNLICEFLGHNNFEISEEFHKDIKKTYNQNTKLISIISYRYNLISKLRKDIIYYNMIIEYYNQYLAL